MSKSKGGSGRGKKHITADSIVYLAGAGWRDSDTSMGAIATTAKKAETLTFKQMREEAKRARESEFDLPRSERKSLSDLMDEIAYYGVHSEKLRDIVSDRQLESAIRDLNEDGYTYPEY